jgi:HAD superfamily hydrolase (TIGR01549 family)
MPAGLHDRIWQEIDRFEVAGMADAQPEAGATEALAMLAQRGHPLAVLTNNARSSALPALAAYDMRKYFRAVLCRDDVPRLKPYPDGLQVAATLLGRPRRLIMVGDSWLDGAAAAAAGGDPASSPERFPRNDAAPLAVHAFSVLACGAIDAAVGGEGIGHRVSPSSIQLNPFYQTIVDNSLSWF